MKKTTGFYPRLQVDSRGGSAVGQAGGVLLTSTVKAAGLDVGLSAALAPWRPAKAVPVYPGVVVIQERLDPFGQLDLDVCWYPRMEVERLLDTTPYRQRAERHGTDPLRSSKSGHPEVCHHTGTIRRPG